MTTYNVSSATVSGYVLSSGDILNIWNGGIANNTSVTSAYVYVSAGGIANNTSVTHAYVYVSAGGTTNNTSLGYQGAESLEGGIANFVTVGNGGREMVAAGGVTNSTTVKPNGREIVNADGTANFTTISAWGTQYISAGGLASGTIISSSGAEVVSINGVTVSASVLSGGEEIVSSGGLASAVTVSSGGLLILSAGGVASATMLSAGGFEAVSAGGVASGTVVSFGGEEIISSGGTSSDTTVSSGGLEVVFSGGLASGTVVEAGADLIVTPGGSASGTVNNGGEVISTGIVVYSPRSAPTNLGTTADGVTLSSLDEEFILSGGTATATTISSGATEIIYAGGTTSNTLVKTGGTEIISAGGVADFTTLSGGQEIISAGGSAVSTTLTDGEVIVSSGGSISGATVYLGGVYVFSGGASYSTVLSGGATEQVYSGAISYDTTLINGASEYVTSATASGTVISANSVEYLSSGATAVGTTILVGGSEIVADASTDSGSVVSGGGFEYLSGTAISESGTVMSGGVLVVQGSASVTGLTLSAGAIVDFSDVASTGTTTVSVDSATGELTIDNGAGTTETIWLNTATIASGTAFSVTADANGDAEITEEAACYRAGTRIRTARGEVAVEDLRVGDLVASALGGRVAVSWIGHRRVDCRRHRKPESVWPVHVAPGAFGPGVPCRDLWLSPDHSVFVEGVLIPIRYLLNDATIRQEPMDTVTYHHVELPQHDVVFAEGLPAESYLDTGNRGAFENGGGAVQLHPDFAPPDFARRVWESEACADLVISGARLAAARARLLGRAQALGHVLTDEPDLRLVVDGREVRGAVAEGAYRFALPAGGAHVRLVSRSSVPAFVLADSDDHRRLGVAISRIALDGQEIALGDTRLGRGWLPVEAGWRWTDGDGALEISGACVLDITLVLAVPAWQKEHQAAALAG